MENLTINEYLNGLEAEVGYEWDEIDFMSTLLNEIDYLERKDFKGYVVGKGINFMCESDREAYILQMEFIKNYINEIGLKEVKKAFKNKIESMVE